ncbi:MAG: NAD-dependent epimerase/dehydratase family protein [Candidatus Scalindua sp.]
MKIGITGATGFIGSHLSTEYLKTGAEVRLLSRNPPKNNGGNWFQGDLTDNTTDLNQFLDGMDILYHCAGELNNESKMYKLHVEGTRNLASAAAGKIKRWVQLSSVGVYGPRRTGLVNEMSRENPVGVYETTKEESDRVLVDIAKKQGMDYAILRPSNIFAEDMNNRSIYQMIEMIRKRLFFYIGKPGVIVNYVHVSAVISALMLCGEHKNAINKTFIVSDFTNLEDMVEKIADGLGVGKPVLRLPEKVIRGIIYILQVLPYVPLTMGRVDALTGRTRYESRRIIDELGYDQPTTLGDQFFKMAQTIKTKTG